MPTYPNLLIHQLSLAGRIKTERQFEAMAEKAASLGASGLELLYDPSLLLPAKFIFKAMKKQGLTKATLCVANLGDESGDPVIRRFRGPALDLVYGGIDRAIELCDAGVEVGTIDGPFAFVLGKQDYPDDAIAGVVEFSKLCADRAETEGVRLALERLQESEDCVIRTAKRLAKVVNAVNSRAFGAHEDTFHAIKNGDSPWKTFSLLGRQVFHFHPNGIGRKRTVEGRIPCGCLNYKIGGVEYTDTTDWYAAPSAMQDFGVDRKRILVCPEPFCRAAFKDMPPLENGVIGMRRLQDLRESINNLAGAGVLVEN